jgi:hypothetical protein
VALSRKILCILLDLSLNQEMYKKPGVNKKTRPLGA